MPLIVFVSKTAFGIQHELFPPGLLHVHAKGVCIVCYTKP